MPSAAGDGSRFCKLNLQIDSKWSETSKKHETVESSTKATVNGGFDQFVSNNSYNTEFHQILSINEAVDQNGELLALKCQNANPPGLVQGNKVCDHDYIISHLAFSIYGEENLPQ